MEDAVLQKFRRFKEMFISSNLPSGTLLELVESYLVSDDTESAVEEIPILEGQLSLFEINQAA